LFAAANELDVLLMVRDAKLVRFDKYGADVEPNLSHIVRTALKKSVEERWQTAAQFRDAIAEWLFVSRHRMTSKIVADVVDELRDAVIERRNRTVNAGTTVLDDVAANPVPGHDAVPVAAVDSETSMPLISVSYDPPTTDPGIAARALSINELAAQLTNPRAETVHARPATRQTVAPAPPVSSGGLTVKRTTPPQRTRPTVACPPRARRDRARRRRRPPDRRYDQRRGRGDHGAGPRAQHRPDHGGTEDGPGQQDRRRGPGRAQRRLGDTRVR